MLNSILLVLELIVQNAEDYNWSSAAAY